MWPKTTLIFLSSNNFIHSSRHGACFCIPQPQHIHGCMDGQHYCYRLGVYTTLNHNTLTNISLHQLPPQRLRSPPIIFLSLWRFSLTFSPSYTQCCVDILRQVIAYGKLSGQLSSNALQLASRDHINMGLGAASVLGLASKLHRVPCDSFCT